jgi:hypothetical protein
MYRAVITLRGEAWLAEGRPGPTHQALAILVSHPLEAIHSRALFDVFCARLGEALGASQSTDECRILWRALCHNDLIAVRGAMPMDTGRAFAIGEPLVEGARPRWINKRDEDPPMPQNLEVRPAFPQSVASASNPPDVPALPRRVSGLVRDTLTRLVAVASDT